MIHPVDYEEYKRLHDERAERLQREARVHAWLRGRPSKWTPLRLWLSEHLKRGAGAPDTGALASS